MSLKEAPILYIVEVPEIQQGVHDVVAELGFPNLIFPNYEAVLKEVMRNPKGIKGFLGERNLVGPSGMKFMDLIVGMDQVIGDSNTGIILTSGYEESGDDAENRYLRKRGNVMTLTKPYQEGLLVQTLEKIMLPPQFHPGR